MTHRAGRGTWKNTSQAQLTQAHRRLSGQRLKHRAGQHGHRQLAQLAWLGLGLGLGLVRVGVRARVRVGWRSQLAQLAVEEQ